MKRERKRIAKYVSLFCLLIVVAFGIATIIASNGGDGGVTVTIDGGHEGEDGGGSNGEETPPEETSMSDTNQFGKAIFGEATFQ